MERTENTNLNVNKTLSYCHSLVHYNSKLFDTLPCAQLASLMLFSHMCKFSEKIVVLLN